MNNLTFGNDFMGYYETIAGGAGAGPSWHGGRLLRRRQRSDFATLSSQRSSMSHDKYEDNWYCLTMVLLLISIRCRDFGASLPCFSARIRN
jgi:hypothetical protein